MTPQRLSEGQLQQLVLEAAKVHGCLVYHTYDSRKCEPGFPDLVIVGRAGVLYRELKSDTGRVSQDQQVWLDRLRAAGQDACVWRPDDWPHRVTTELKAIARRGAS